MSYELVNYSCDRCSEDKIFEITKKEHEVQLGHSANGLVRYSHLHSCKEQILGVTNLQVDANYDVRGLEPLQFPDNVRKGEEKKKPAIPMPVTTKTGQKFNITTMMSGKSIVMLYSNSKFGYEIIIGRRKKDEKPQKELKTSTSSLKYFKSDITGTKTLDSWLQAVIDLIESQLPTRLGLVIGAFIQVFENEGRSMSRVYRKALKDLLSSHAVVIRPGNNKLEKVKKELLKTFNEETLKEMESVVADLSLTPEQSLLDLLGIIPDDPVKLIFDLYALKKHGVVEIERFDVGSEEEKKLRK